jgi:hypothetical protein
MAMAHRTRAALVAALLLVAPATARAALSTYSQNFESLVLTAPAALGNDGWLVYGNVFDATNTTWIRGYGPNPAPNDGAEPYDGYAFCAVVSGQGGDTQGDQQLSVYSDYNNTVDHGAGRRVESNVFHEQTVGAANVNQRWVFSFDAKLGNLVPTSTATAFIKTLDPAHGYALTNFRQLDMTSIPATWGRYSIAITIDAGLVNQVLQFGFLNNATGFQPSGIYYDNVLWNEDYTTAVVPGATAVHGLDLMAAAPNPFVRSTRIFYSVPRACVVDLSLYDITGRRVAVLFRGTAEPGSHAATWDGRFSDGRPAPAGVYRYVLQTADGRRARSLVLNR